MKRLLLIKAILIILTLFSFDNLWAKTKPLNCTPRAFNLIKTMPTLFTSEEQKKHKDRTWDVNKIIPENVYALDWPTVRHLHPEWSNRMDKYLKALERWAGPNFWKIPTQELQACMVTRKPGEVDPNQPYDDIYADLLFNDGEEYPGLMGDEKLRLLNQFDISLEPRNSTPFNSIVLYQTPKGTQAILVYDGAFSRSDPGAALFDRINSPLPLVEFYFCTSAGGGSCSYRYYTIDPAHKRLVEYPLFQNGPLNFSYIVLPMVQENESISAPQISIKGKLSPKFQTKYSSYSLEGRHFVASSRTNLTQTMGTCREELKKNFNPTEKEPWSKITSCKSLYEKGLRCPIDNDLSYLFYQKQKKEAAKIYAIKALKECSGNKSEFKAAEHNYRKAIEK